MIPPNQPVHRAAGAALALPFRAAPLAATVTLVLTVLAGAAPATGVWLTMLLVDELAADSASTGRVVPLALAAAVAGGVAIALLYLAGHLADVVQQRVTLIVESRLFRRMSTLPGLRHIEDPVFHDRLRLAEQAAQEAPGTVSMFAQELIRSAVLLTSFAGALLAVWPPMTLLLLATVVTTVLARLATVRRQAAVEEAWVATDRRRLFYRALLTDVRAAKEIRLFGLGALLHGRMVDSLARTSKARLAAAQRGALTQAALALLGAAVTGVGTVVVAANVIGGRSSVGDLVLFLGAVTGVQSGLSSVVLQLGEAGRALRLFGHYLDVLGTEDDLPLGAGRTPTGPATIELRDVWFRYRPDGPWVLRGVNLTIPAGASLGLVGANGAGKSTIVKLLCRFYDPQRGTITWGGTDIRELDLAALRARIGVVFQEFMTYDLTAAENIGIGSVDQLGNRPLIVDAAAASGVANTLSALPNGYDTMLSRTHASDDDTGVTLSGGQWQRVALARCLMRTGAELMVLDEPTAGLDVEGEHRLHTTLLRHADGRTRLLISHRLAALRTADVVVTLADGQIVEQGTHDDLMNADGEYARLFRLQAGGYQDSRVLADGPR